MQDTKNALNNFCILNYNQITINNLKKRYIALDVETTGLDPLKDRIIEIGAVLFENGQVIKTFNSLVNPHVIIPLEVSNINHITNQMLKSAPEEKEVYANFIAFLSDATIGKTIICAHNARFDLGFLKETFRRLGYFANIYYVDTLSLARQTLPNLPNHKLNTVASYLDINNEKSHRAYSDALVCGKILWKLINKL